MNVDWKEETKDYSRLVYTITFHFHNCVLRGCQKYPRTKPLERRKLFSQFQDCPDTGHILKTLPTHRPEIQLLVQAASRQLTDNQILNT